MERRSLSESGLSRGLLPERIRAERSERTIAEWSFPAHIWDAVAEAFPQAAGGYGRGLVEQGLRDWFICCAWRGKRELGMPSRVVDEAWHELILDSVAYFDFCRVAFGGYLHHYPASKPRATGASPIFNTIWAWDRSKAGRNEDECSLWDLDYELRVSDPWGISAETLLVARSNKYEGDGRTWAGALALPPNAKGGGGGGCGSGGVTADGDGGGGGCGGGGCGGGGG